MENTPPRAPAQLKLLVPTNFSHKAELALQFALAYSHNRVGGSAEIFLFHSYDERKVDYRELDKINETLIDHMKAAVLHAIEALEQRGVGHSVGTVHRRLSYGKPAGEILKVAAGIGADLIVMGSPNSSKFRGLIEKAPCSLVLLKDKDPTFVME